jgi:hypothetical protein
MQQSILLWQKYIYYVLSNNINNIVISQNITVNG